MHEDRYRIHVDDQPGRLTMQIRTMMIKAMHDDYVASEYAVLKEFHYKMLD